MGFIIKNITSGPPVTVAVNDLGITLGIPAAEVTDVTTVADSAGSLNSTYFTLNAIAAKYYVWYDVSSGGVDPAPAGRTGIEVDITTNDTANTVASNTQTAVDAVADFGASVSTNIVTITNAVTGEIANAKDGAAATGFTFNVTTQGDGTRDLARELSVQVAQSTDLIDSIGAGDIVVLDQLDDTTQLSVADGITAVSTHNDPHFRGGPGVVFTINVQDEGTNVTNTPHTTLDFVGAGVTATDGGAGVATITIPGGASQDVFREVAADSGANSIADSGTDILTLAGGIGVATVSTPAADTITITANPSRIVSFVIENPTASDQQVLQHKFGEAVTITRVSASTDTGTATIQFDERVETTPNTGGTDVLTAVLVADTNSEITTAFANAGIAADAILNMSVDAVSGSPTVVRVHVEFELA